MNTPAYIDLFLCKNGEMFWAVYVNRKPLMTFASFEAAARFVGSTDSGGAADG